MHPAAVAATHEAMLALNANPHAHEHAAGWRAADAVELARREVAEAIGGDADEIVFTAGATEANNLALLGSAPRLGERHKLLVTAFEHKAVLGPARELERRGFDVSIVPVTRAGLVEPKAVANLIDERTLLVSCMAVNNEVGTIQPIAAIARLCRQVGALLHVDAAQALSWSAVDVSSFDADLVSLSAHKAGGPKGVGALWVRREIRDMVGPISFGGEQEGGLRPGTLPTALCIGFGAACRHLPTIAEVDAWRALRTAFEQRVCEAFPGVVINGSAVERHPGAISLTLPDGDAETLILRLQPDVAISRGSACTSGIPEPSHVLRAIGLDARACDRTVRISIGRTTTQEELDQAFEAIHRTYQDLLN